MNWPVHGQVHASGWLITAADTGLFLMTSSNSSATAGAGVCARECVHACADHCAHELGLISSCNTQMTLLFHFYPASRRYYHINTCVIKAPQTISWII